MPKNFHNKVRCCVYHLLLSFYVRPANYLTVTGVALNYARAQRFVSISITNLMHWLLFIQKILFSSTCFEPQVLIFRRIQLYTCSIWYCHSLWEFLVASRNSHKQWQYHMLHVYNCILLKMSTWGSKHVEENSILWINNNQCIKLVINIWSLHDARSEKHQVTKICAI